MSQSDDEEQKVRVPTFQDKCLDQIEEEVEARDNGRRYDSLALKAIYLLIHEIRELRKDIKESNDGKG